jgi:hypothetical protein
MFNLRTASLEIRKCAKAGWSITRGQWKPVNAGTAIEALPDDAPVAKVWNRRFPEGVTITAGDVRYAGRYL